MRLNFLKFRFILQIIFEIVSLKDTKLTMWTAHRIYLIARLILHLVQTSLLIVLTLHHLITQDFFSRTEVQLSNGSFRFSLHT